MPRSFLNRSMLILFLAVGIACAVDIASMRPMAQTQSLSDMGNDPAYPPQLYFVGVASSPNSQTDADNLAMAQVQKQITVVVRVQQESGISSDRRGQKEVVNRWLDSRATLTSGANLQGVEIVKRSQNGRHFISVAVLKKSKFAASKRLEMQETGKKLISLVSQAQADAEAGHLSEALSVRSRIEQLVRHFESERLLLSAAESLTDQDMLPVDLEKMNKALTKALKALKVKVVSGDQQELKDPSQHVEPWIVSVQAKDQPVADLPLKLLEGRKTLRTAVTDEQGQAVFYPDAFARRKAGEHTYKVMADLEVTRAQYDIIERKRASFTYKITPEQCPVNLQVLGAKSSAQTALSELLANYGLTHDQHAKKRLVARLSVQEKGMSQGLSQKTSFTLQQVTLQLDLLDAAGRSKQKALTSATGHGNQEQAIQRAIEKMELGASASMIHDAACGQGSVAANRPTLAILPFNAVRWWYGDAAKASLLSDMIAGTVHQLEGYQIVERTRLNDLLEEQAAGASGIIADPVEMGGLLGAQYVMVGTLMSDSGIRVEGRVIEVSTGKVYKTFSAKGRLESIAESIAKQILPE